MTNPSASPSIHFGRSIVRLLVPLLAAIAAVAASLVAIAIAGKSPWTATLALLDGSLGSRSAAAATIARMVPLLLVALGWIVAFSTRRVSIGFEGQILAGGAAATLVGLNLGGLPAPLHLTLAVLAGTIGGMIWVLLPAVMWARRGVHEIISTLLMNLIAFEMVSWLVRGPLQEETGAFARTNDVHASSLWPELLVGTRLHWDIVLVFALIVATWIVLRKTTIGLQLRFVGSNPTAARYLGVESRTVSVYALIASGGFAGLAGASLILAAATSTMSPNFSAGYGFEGIVVALLARNNAIAAIPAAFLFAVLGQGSGLLEARLDVSSAVITLSLGLVVILMASTGFVLTQQRDGHQKKTNKVMP